MFKRFITIFVIISFILSYYQPVYAQDFSVDELPVPGKMVGVSAPFDPLTLKGLVVNPQKPLEFQFIVDTGTPSVIIPASAKIEATHLIKYFLSGLTIPEGELWVNLSPYEKNRMVPSALGQTELGRDLLAQDYILKQLTASLIYPEKDLGREFWNRVYKKAQEQFGTTNIPVNTFNKVWILPDQSQVFENGPAAYVTKATLKVMLDEDYLALQKNSRVNNTHSIASKIVREIILPEIEHEVNTGKNFAPLRQIYDALILAKWYKETIQNSLLDAIYTNKKKLTGINLNDPAIKEQIYDRYLQAYKKGVFNYIKEGLTPEGQTIPRKYFSGGLTPMPDHVKTDGAMSAVNAVGELAVLDVNLEPPRNAAMLVQKVGELPQDLHIVSSKFSDLLQLEKDLMGHYYIVARDNRMPVARPIFSISIKTDSEFLAEYIFKTYTTSRDVQKDFQSLDWASNIEINKHIGIIKAVVQLLESDMGIFQGEGAQPKKVMGILNAYKEVYGIYNIGALVEKTADELLHYRSIGKGNLNYIRKVLSGHGLYLRGEWPIIGGDVIDAGIMQIGLKDFRDRYTLFAYRLDTVGQVMDKTEDELSRMIITAKGIRSIKEFLAQYGLHLKGDSAMLNVPVRLLHTRFLNNGDVIPVPFHRGMKRNFDLILTGNREIFFYVRLDKNGRFILGAERRSETPLFQGIRYLPKNVLIDIHGDNFSFLRVGHSPAIYAIRELGYPFLIEPKKVKVLNLKSDQRPEGVNINVWKDTSGKLSFFVEGNGQKVYFNSVSRTFNNSGLGLDFSFLQTRNGFQIINRSASEDLVVNDQSSQNMSIFRDDLLRFLSGKRGNRNSYNAYMRLVGTILGDPGLLRQSEIEKALRSDQIERIGGQVALMGPTDRLDLSSLRWEAFNAHIEDEYLNYVPKIESAANAAMASPQNKALDEVLQGQAKITSVQSDGNERVRILTFDNATRLEITVVGQNKMECNFQAGHLTLQAVLEGTPSLARDYSAGVPITRDDAIEAILQNMLISGLWIIPVERATQPVDTKKAVKILFADAPAGNQTIANIEQALDQVRQAHPGVPIEIIRSETGVGSKGTAALLAVMEKEKPAIIFVRSETKVFSSQDKTQGFDYRTFIERAKKEYGLKVVVRLGAGYDNIDTQITRENGISVVRTHGNAGSVADLTLYLMASLVNMQGFPLGQATGAISTSWDKISQTAPAEYGLLNNKSKKWPKGISGEIQQSILSTMNRHLILTEDPLKALAAVLEGKTVGLLGFGAIAQETARQLQRIKEATGVNFKVIAYTRSFAADADRRQEAVNLGVTPVLTPDALFEQSNILSVHVPDGIDLKIKRADLAHKNILAVINTARDGAIETVDDFVARGGVLLGDLDLTPKYVGLMQEHPDTVMVLPHIGASTQSAGAGIEGNTVPVAVEIVRRLLGESPESGNKLEIVNNTPIPLQNDAAMGAQRVTIGEAEKLMFNGKTIDAVFTGDGHVNLGIGFKDDNYGLKRVFEVWRYGNLFLRAPRDGRELQFLIWSQDAGEFRVITQSDLRIYFERKFKKGVSLNFNQAFPLEVDGRIIRNVDNFKAEGKMLALKSSISRSDFKIDMQGVVDFFADYMKGLAFDFNFSKSTTERTFIVYQEVDGREHYEGAVIVENLTSQRARYLAVPNSADNGGSFPSDRFLKSRVASSKLQDWQEIPSGKALFVPGRIFLRKGSTPGDCYFFCPKKDIMWKFQPREVNYDLAMAVDFKVAHISGPVAGKNFHYPTILTTIERPFTFISQRWENERILGKAEGNTAVLTYQVERNGNMTSDHVILTLVKKPNGDWEMSQDYKQTLMDFLQKYKIIQLARANLNNDKPDVIVVEPDIFASSARAIEFIYQRKVIRVPTNEAALRLLDDDGPAARKIGLILTPSNKLIQNFQKYPSVPVVIAASWAGDPTGKLGANTLFMPANKQWNILISDILGTSKDNPGSNPAMGVEKGGIDLNQINVKRTGKKINVQFDPAQLNDLLQGGFQGFAPVVTDFEYIKSPFPLLGVSEAKAPEVLAKA